MKQQSAELVLGEEVYTPEDLRTSSNNMIIRMSSEPLAQDEQNQIEELFAVAN